MYLLGAGEMTYTTKITENVEKSAAKFAHIKQKQYLCTRFREGTNLHTKTTQAATKQSRTAEETKQDGREDKAE